MPYKGKYVSIIIPAHDEEGSIAEVVMGIASLCGSSNDERLVDEIIVCDNNSSDTTAKKASDAGANVVFEAQKGYGAACLKGIETLNKDTKYVVFVDGDSFCRYE